MLADQMLKCSLNYAPALPAGARTGGYSRTCYPWLIDRSVASDHAYIRRSNLVAFCLPKVRFLGFCCRCLCHDEDGEVIPGYTAVPVAESKNMTCSKSAVNHLDFSCTS